MSSPSFVSGEEETIEVKEQDGSYYVGNTESANEIICFFQDKAPSIESGSREFRVQIRKYRQAVAGEKNYLTVQSLDDRESTKREQNTGSSEQVSPPDSPPAPADTSSSANSSSGSEPTGSRYPERNLVQFDGSGDYVTIEAEVLGIEFVEKNTPEMPDLRGVLGESSSIKKLPFVVSDDVSHPYLEEGKKFRFEGVKDHRYEHKNEIQALITEHTVLTEIE